MKGARTLLGGILILAAVCAVPAVSAAQDSGSAETTTTGTEPPAPQQPAPEPSAPADPTLSPPSHGGTARTGGDGGGGGGQAGSQQSDASPRPATASSPTDRTAHASAATRVTIKDFLFSPATVTVHTGDLVTWHNSGKQPHTATADDGSFDTGTLTSGQSASHMFTQPGTFTYYCTIHPNMHGTVKVLGASGSGGSAGSGGSGGATASSSATGPTEAQAVASPNAAGDKNSLAATGMAAGGLALVGFLLLASGVAARYSGRRAAASVVGKQLELF
jgi:plastocyanin